MISIAFSYISYTTILPTKYNFICNGMYGSSNVVLGISSSSLLWELEIINQCSLLVSVLYRCLIRMNDKLRIL